MQQAIQRFWIEDDGQDLVEYTLLLGSMILGAAGFFGGGGSSVSTICSAENANLRNAASAASS